MLDYEHLPFLFRKYFSTIHLAIKYCKSHHNKATWWTNALGEHLTMGIIDDDYGYDNLNGPFETFPVEPLVSSKNMDLHLDSANISIVSSLLLAYSCWSSIVGFCW